MSSSSTSPESLEGHWISSFWCFTMVANGLLSLPGPLLFLQVLSGLSSNERQPLSTDREGVLFQAERGDWITLQGGRKRSLLPT